MFPNSATTIIAQLKKFTKKKKKNTEFYMKMGVFIVCKLHLNKDVK